MGMNGPVFASSQFLREIEILGKENIGWEFIVIQ